MIKITQRGNRGFRLAKRTGGSAYFSLKKKGDNWPELSKYNRIPNYFQNILKYHQLPNLILFKENHSFFKFF